MKLITDKVKIHEVTELQFKNVFGVSKPAWKFNKVNED